MIETLERLLGQTAKKEFLPMQPGDVYETYADTTALERDFGFRIHTPLEEGIGVVRALVRCLSRAATVDRGIPWTPRTCTSSGTAKPTGTLPDGFRTQSDIPMNDVGFEQARRAGDLLFRSLSDQMTRNESTSSHRRFCERGRPPAKSAAPIARDEQDMEVSDVLTEISLGDWEGMTTHEVKAAFPRVAARPQTGPVEFCRAGRRELCRANAGNRGVPGRYRTSDRAGLSCGASSRSACISWARSTDKPRLVSPITHGKIYAWSKRRLAAH